MELHQIIANQKKTYQEVQKFYRTWGLHSFDMGITSYTRNNINIEIYKKDLRNYFIRDNAVIYLPFTYKYFKVRVSI